MNTATAGKHTRAGAFGGNGSTLPRTANFSFRGFESLGIFWGFFSWLVERRFSCGFVWLGVFNRTIQKKPSKLALSLKQYMDVPLTAYLKNQNQEFQRRHPKSMALIYTILFP